MTQIKGMQNGDFKQFLIDSNALLSEIHTKKFEIVSTDYTCTSAHNMLVHNLVIVYDDGGKE